MELSRLRCFIPVGGEAKRLKPLTQDISKPCIRFLNRPLIEFPMAHLAEQGVRNFILGVRGYTNYTNLFDQYGEGVGFSAKYRIEPRVHIKYQPNLEDLGSADSYRVNIEYYDVRDPVLVIQGDNLFELNLPEFVRRHEESGAVMTIALARVENVEEYGIAELRNDLRLQRFVEKPTADAAPSNLANAGVYLISPEVREIVEGAEIRALMAERSRLDFGYDFIPYLVDQGFPVYGYELDVWYDVGSPERYLKTMHEVLHGALNIRVLEERIAPDKNIWVQGYSEDSIKRRQEIFRKYNEQKLFFEGAALIGRHTRIGNYSRIVDSNLDNFCILGDHVTVEKSAIMDAARIGEYAQIAASILGRKVVVDSTRQHPTYITANSVLGNAVSIGKGCRLIRTRINPGLTIPPGLNYNNAFLQTSEDVIELAQ
jgi:NDP-sugar pyrophosphorylase family protein